MVTNSNRNPDPSRPSSGQNARQSVQRRTKLIHRCLVPRANLPDSPRRAAGTGVDYIQSFPTPPWAAVRARAAIGNPRTARPANSGALVIAGELDAIHRWVCDEPLSDTGVHPYRDIPCLLADRFTGWLCADAMFRRSNPKKNVVGVWAPSSPNSYETELGSVRSRPSARTQQLMMAERFLMSILALLPCETKSCYHRIKSVRGYELWRRCCQRQDRHCPVQPRKNRTFTPSLR